MGDRLKRNDKILKEIYTKLFKEAQPPIDYEDLEKQNEKKKFGEGWFKKYYLAQDRQEEIIKDICKKHRCRAWEITAFSNTVALGHSPVGHKRRGEGEHDG